MGRDDNKHVRRKRLLAQTPKNQISDDIDVEFSEELANEEDKKAQARMRQADQRAKKKK